ncbi:hypothetical protein HYW99_02880 [Candidatus Woesearchaeota archaeon]|nr:hypothetical protein [Candidatus Woesearchaeota archaeon]
MAYVYLSAIIIGLIHGLEPGHGWPVAVYYSLNKERRFLYGFITSSILAFFHFFSSIAVVVLFLLFNKALNFTSFPTAKYVAFGILLILAIKAWFEKPYRIEKKKTKTLWHLASYAFVLGFVHEEEFAILAFCIGGNNCIALMIVYALAVTFTLLTITLLSIKSYELIAPKIQKYEKYLPKIFGIILFLIAISYLFRF